MISLKDENEKVVFRDLMRACTFTNVVPIEDLLMRNNTEVDKSPLFCSHDTNSDFPDNVM
jgi:hypothetical protein